MLDQRRDKGDVQSLEDQLDHDSGGTREASSKRSLILKQNGWIYLYSTKYLESRVQTIGGRGNQLLDHDSLGLLVNMKRRRRELSAELDPGLRQFRQGLQNNSGNSLQRIRVTVALFAESSPDMCSGGGSYPVSSPSE